MPTPETVFHGNGRSEAESPRSGADPIHRVLAVYSLSHAWDRSLLRGLLDVSRCEGWELLRYPPTDGIHDVVKTWRPSVVLVERPIQGMDSGRLDGVPAIATNIDLSDRGMPSVCCDDEAIARLAASHFAEVGIKHLAGFCYSQDAFAINRIQGFLKAAEQHGVTYHSGGEFSSEPTHAAYASHESIIRWLQKLPRPCGVFAACDGWASPLAQYCRLLGLRIPDHIALVGADNDALVCELSSPPLSSVAIPWRRMGHATAGLVRDLLQGKPLPLRTQVQPVGVVARRSSDLLSVYDTEVAKAVRWIRANAHRPIHVSEIVRSIPTYRQRLERLFKAHLGRTIMKEVRMAHVARAKELLASTDLPITQLAIRSGFTSATTLGVCFQNETGMTPSAFRRQFDRDPGMEATDD